MFCALYFCRRMFAARYWAKVGAAPPPFKAGWASNANTYIGLTPPTVISK